MDSDADLRESMLAVASDRELTALALDRARVRGSRREVAERLLGRIGELK